jgi:hypothetical protein
MEKTGRDLISYHCLLYQESFCAKSIDIRAVLNDKVVKIINCIRSSPLRHRKFKDF